MKRPRATAPRPREAQPTVLMRVDSSGPSSSSDCLGKGRTPLAEMSSLVGPSSGGVERNFMIIDDSSRSRGAYSTVGYLDAAFVSSASSVLLIGSLDVNF